MIAANDWTGSSAKRQEQGGCINYGKYPNQSSRWYIPAGTIVQVCQVIDCPRRWLRYKTKEDVPFNKNEGGRDGAVLVRYRGWFVLTQWREVRKRQ